jgi:hypothetical protein
MSPSPEGARCCITIVLGPGISVVINQPPPDQFQCCTTVPPEGSGPTRFEQIGDGQTNDRGNPENSLEQQGAGQAAGDAGTYLIDKGFKAPRQVTPGIRVITGEYANDIGPGGVRVEPWKAYYDQYGRLIARTDYNAGNASARIPSVHHTVYNWVPAAARVSPTTSLESTHHD